MKNKTAMQQLIDWLECGWKNEDINAVIKKAKQLKKEEKIQIIFAYMCDLYPCSLEDAENHYNQYYGDNT